MHNILLVYGQHQVWAGLARYFSWLSDTKADLIFLHLLSRAVVGILYSLGNAEIVCDVVLSVEAQERSQIQAKINVNVGEGCGIHFTDQPSKFSSVRQLYTRK